jgi:hypothetical protein
MTVSWPADTKLFARGTTATRNRLTAQIDAPTLVRLRGADAFAAAAAARLSSAATGGAQAPLAAARADACQAVRADADALAGSLAPVAALAPVAVALAWVLAALAT